MYSSYDDGVARKQFPLVLAWALTHWKAQGMTLGGARVHLSEKTVGVAGLAFVACTRVRHPWDLVFEDDLPDYEHFMKARATPAFRRRRRWELRLQQRASATLRRYGYCTADRWTKDEVAAADSLLTALWRRASQQRETLRSRAGRVVDDSTWLWGQQEPCYEELLTEVRRELVPPGTEQSQIDLYESVSLRLLDRWRRRELSPEEKYDAWQLLSAAEQTGRVFDSEELIQQVVAGDHSRFHRYVEIAKLVRRRLTQVPEWDGMIEEPVPAHLGGLHLPAVKWAVGALIPDKLHERYDKYASRQQIPKLAPTPQGGSYLRCDGWRVSVYEEESLARGRLTVGMLEFFLKLLARCSSQLSLGLSVGSRMLGKMVATAASIPMFCRVLSGWKECWNRDEVKKRQALCFPAPTVEHPEPRDWVAVVVCARDGSSCLGDAKQLQVRVYDRMVRKDLNDRIARFVQALFFGEEQSVAPVVIHEYLPECLVAHQRIGCVLGVIVVLVQERAGQKPLDRSSPTYVPDMFSVFRTVFGHLRSESAARTLTDIKEYVVGEESRKVLSMFGEVTRTRSSLVAHQAKISTAAAQDTGAVIMKAFTWNVCGGRRSDRAPDAWLQEDQRNQVVNEVLRWGCDVVALQEVESREPIQRLMHRYSHVGSSVATEGVEVEGSIDPVAQCYSHVGSSRSHHGFVQLYVSKTLNFVHRHVKLPGAVVCSLSLKAAGSDVHHPVTLAAVHLPSGLAQDKVDDRSRILDEIVRGADESGVFILGDMNCKDEEAMAVCDKNHLREACYSGSSWGSRSNRYYDSNTYDGVGLRYDRMFVGGGLWAETFVASYRRTFFEGCDFFLSDHFPVVGFFEFDGAFRQSGPEADAMARARRDRLARLRDDRLREEQLESFELLKRGKEDRGYAKDVAFERVREAALREQREALVERERSARRRLDAAVGSGSVWCGQIEENALRELAMVPLIGWDVDGWDVDVPSDVFLRGITSGQTDVVMPCLLQVLLRLPHMHSWIAMHLEHCRASRGCALCWLSTVQRALGDHVNRRNVQVGFLPEDVKREDVQDMKVVFEKILCSLSESEIESGRIGEMPVADLASVVVTHVDRIFGWFQQTRVRCKVCGLQGESTVLCKSKILTLPLKSVDLKHCTVTDLYLDSLLAKEEVLPCRDCEVSTNHDVSSRVATTPEVLLLWLDRGVEKHVVSLDVEEDLMLPGLVPLRLFAVIYRVCRPDGVACYSCACRGPMDAWWYFEEGRSPQPIKFSVSHMKQKSSCMLVYERVVIRGRTTKRKTVWGSKKRSPTETVVPPARSCSVVAVPAAWPLRALKRYPSWVDHLQLQTIRQARVVGDAVLFARRCVDEGLCPAGRELADVVLQGVAKQHDTGNDRFDLTEYFFVCACVANAFDRMRLESEDCEFASLCHRSHRLCLGEAMSRARRTPDPSVAVDIVSRVTGIVDLDPVELELFWQESFRTRLEREAALVVPRCYRELELPCDGEQSCGGNSHTLEGFGIRLGEAVMEEFEELFQCFEDISLGLSCVSNVFDCLGRASQDSSFVTLCTHARRWCIREARDQARECVDASVAMEVVSRVTGIADFDEPGLALEQGDGSREGLAEGKPVSILVVGSDDEDADALSSRGAELLPGTPACGSCRGESSVARGSEALGDSKAVVSVPGIVTLGHSLGTDGQMLSEAQLRDGGGAAVVVSATSSSEVPGVSAMSVSVVEDSKRKSTTKRAGAGESAPVRRSRRIADRLSKNGT